MADDGLSLTAALRGVRERDEAFARFVAHHFHRDLRDPEQFDPILNTEAITVAAAIEIIVAGYHARFARGLARAATASESFGM